MGEVAAHQCYQHLKLLFIHERRLVRPSVRTLIQTISECDRGKAPVNELLSAAVPGLRVSGPLNTARPLNSK